MKTEVARDDAKVNEKGRKEARRDGNAWRQRRISPCRTKRWAKMMIEIVDGAAATTEVMIMQNAIKNGALKFDWADAEGREGEISAHDRKVLKSPIDGSGARRLD